MNRLNVRSRPGRPSRTGRRTAGGGGGGGGFSPSSIDDLSLWLDASDASTIAATGSAVDTWTDKSPTGTVFEDYGTAPQTGVRSINGLNAMNFNANGAFRPTTAVRINNASNGTWTIFAVVVVDAFQGRGIVDQDNGSNRIAQYLNTQNGTAPKSVGSVSFATNGDIKHDNGPAFATTTPVIVHSLRETATIEAFLNGTGDGALVPTASNRTASDTNLRIGSGWGGSGSDNFYLDGLIGEIAGYARALDAEEVTAVLEHLAAKWGITLPS